MRIYGNERTKAKINKVLSRFAKDRTVRRRKSRRKEQEKSGVLNEDHSWACQYSLYLRPGLLGLGCSAQRAIALTQDDLTEKSGFDGT
jgi:hypothetical protein